MAISSNRDRNERMAEISRIFKRPDGSVDIALGTGTPDGKEKVEFVYKKLPDNQVGQGISKRTLEIEFSSVEGENEELLHQLLQSTRKQGFKPKK